MTCLGKLRFMGAAILLGPVFLAAALAVLTASARTAHAEINGDCEAFLNGEGVASLNSAERSDDIHVTNDARVPFQMTSSKGFKSHKIQLEFGGRRWTVSSKQDNGEQEFSDYANVQDYATYGVGLYKVVGVATLTDGSRCSGAATVDVDGNPLATVAGATAAGAVALGTVVALASGAAAAAGAGTGGGGGEPPAEPAYKPPTPEEEALQREMIRWQIQAREYERRSILGCFWSLPMLLLGLLMLPFMAISPGGGGEAEPPPTPVRRLPRAPWRPRITLLGVVSGLLAGAGGVVLLQQYSLELPTQFVIIRTLVVSTVVYGLLVPTLGRTIAVMRVNRRLAAIERRGA